MSVLSPPARAASLHLAFLPLRAPLPADKLRKPGHLQNAPLQSHPPRGQPDLLPEDEEKGLGEPEGRAEAEGAEILWQLKNKHRGHRPVRPQEPPRSLISGTRSRAVLGAAFQTPPRHSTATNTTFASSLQAGDSAFHTGEITVCP